MNVFLAPECWPFVVATILLLLITVIEGIALMIGLSASHWLDSLLPDPGDGIHGAFDGWLGWLHVGKVPVLVLLVTFLASFAVVGFALTLVVHRLTDILTPTLISTPIALIAALPAVRGLGNTLARLLPKDQSYAVSLDSLVGRIGTVISGTARQGYPTQAKVATEHGQTLYVMVEPDCADITLQGGDSVLLVRQLSGNRFQAIRNPRPDLL